MMDPFEIHPPLSDRIALAWQRSVRIATRLAIAFGLSTVTAILLGAAVTDNALAQIIVTLLAALGLWIPFAVLVTAVARFLKRSPAPPAAAVATDRRGAGTDDSWVRLSALAPAYSERLVTLRRSLERSRLALGRADLDPDAHDLCVLIDRRLPELMHRELDSLPPDDRNRGRQIGELVDLIEQFARHCSRKQAGDRSGAGREAAILRRRFEDRLSGSQGLSVIGPEPN